MDGKLNENHICAWEQLQENSILSIESYQQQQSRLTCKQQNQKLTSYFFSKESKYIKILDKETNPVKSIENSKLKRRKKQNKFQFGENPIVKKKEISNNNLIPKLAVNSQFSQNIPNKLQNLKINADSKSNPKVVKKKAFSQINKEKKLKISNIYEQLHEQIKYHSKSVIKTSKSNKPKKGLHKKRIQKSLQRQKKQSDKENALKIQKQKCCLCNTFLTLNPIFLTTSNLFKYNFPSQLCYDCLRQNSSKYLLNRKREFSLYLKQKIRNKMKTAQRCELQKHDKTCKQFQDKQLCISVNKNVFPVISNLQYEISSPYHKLYSKNSEKYIQNLKKSQKIPEQNQKHQDQINNGSRKIVYTKKFKKQIQKQDFNPRQQRISSLNSPYNPISIQNSCFFKRQF